MSTTGIELSHLITSKKATIGIVGMGYVGFPLAKLTTEDKFKTIGFVRQEEKAKRINDIKIENLFATTNKKLLAECDVILVCVQTPTFKNRKPDLRFLKIAIREIAQSLRPGQLISIESSIAPGTTRNIVLPILKKTGLIEGKDYFLGFSPERIDPGNKTPLNEVPKIVSGLSTVSRYLTELFYNQIIQNVTAVSSVETAEFVKIFENSFRLVNISLVNQFLEYTNSIKVDMWEAVDAATTKPYGFLPHYPGPGIGGHCIPVDPYYLLDDAKKKGFDLTLVEDAGEICFKQPEKVVKRIFKILDKINEKNLLTRAVNQIKAGQINKSTNGEIKKPKVLLLGISYKADIDDLRESPALDIWKLLEKKGCNVSYFDPYITEVNGIKSVKILNSISEHDLLVLITDHKILNYDFIADFGTPILDTRHILDNKKFKNIYYL